MSGEATEKTEPIMLRDFCKAEHAVALRDGIMARRGGAVRLSGRAVPMLSALAAQVLVAAQRTWRVDGHPFEIVEPSEDLARDIRLLGLVCLIEGEDPVCL